MPRRKRAIPESGSSIPAELLDELVQGPMTQKDLEAVMRSFKKALIERILGGELSHHLGYEAGEEKPVETTIVATVQVMTESGAVRIQVPRDRKGTFEPLLIGKHERRLEGFDDKILALYAGGMTVREIQGYLMEMYGWPRELGGRSFLPFSLPGAEPGSGSSPSSPSLPRFDE